MSSEPILVIEYGAESYVQMPRYGYDSERTIINGRGWPRAVGDESFFVVQGKVKTLGRTVPPRTVTTKYTLRQDLICANKPAWLTPEQWAKLPEADQALYVAEQEMQAQPSVDLPFRVVNGRAAPRKLPAGVKPVLPHHVNTYPWYWWTLPCVATSDYVFAELSKRVETLKPEEFAVTVYTNIKTIWVQAHAFDIGGVQFTPQSSLLRIDRDSGVPSFNGETADEAIAKAQAWCGDKMRAITTAQGVTECPCCRQKLPKGKRARITAKKHGYRIGHDISK